VSRAALGDPHPIDAPGTDETSWTAWLDALPGTGMTGLASAVIVAAHPDDEVLGVGGLISELAAAGARLRLVAVTDGENSHGDLGDPAALAERRTAETAAALRALGAEATDVIRLGLPDSKLADHEEQLAAALPRLASGFDVCFAPWDHDMHPDHEAAGRAARRYCPRVLCYPVWMWHWASPGDRRVPWDRAFGVPLSPQATARKRAAIGCFASQTQSRSPELGPVLSPGMLAHFTRTTEVLIR
jgi:LmbE family N-acetylglucosaminyl deacetylase